MAFDPDLIDPRFDPHYCGDIEGYEGQLGSAFSSLLADSASQSDSFIYLWNTYERALKRTGQNVRAEFYEGGDQWALVEFRTLCGHMESYSNYANLYVFSRTGDNWAVPRGYGDVTTRYGGGFVRWLGEGNGWLVETAFGTCRGCYTSRLLHVQPEGSRGSDVLAEQKAGGTSYPHEFVITPNRLIVFVAQWPNVPLIYNCEIETDAMGTIYARWGPGTATVKEFEMVDGRYSLRDEKSDATVLWLSKGEYGESIGRSWFSDPSSDVRSIDENVEPIDLDWLVELWEAECKDAD